MNPESDRDNNDQPQSAPSSNDETQHNNQGPSVEPTPQSEYPGVRPAQEVTKPSAPDSYRELKSILVKILLGCLVAAAGVAVVAILIGTMNEVAWKSVATIFSALAYILILFGILSIAAPTNPLLKKSSDLAINTSILIIVASFFTSIFGIWDVLDADIAGKLYATYFVAIISILHAKVLMDSEVMYAKVRPYVYANYAFVLLVAALILGAVYSPPSWDLLSGFYGRALAASAIIDITLSIIIAVMQRLYFQKHPEVKEQFVTKAGSPVAKIIIAVLLFFFVVWPIMGMVLAFARWGS